jgi:hypothetical protein
MLYQSELRPRMPLTAEWWGEDSNLRRRPPADLQSAPFSHSGTPPLPGIRPTQQTTPHRKPGWNHYCRDGSRALPPLMELTKGLEPLTC